MSELYSDNRETNWKVGLITLISVLSLVLGYGWLRHWLEHKDLTPMTVWFANANGIEPGDDVTINGVKVGRVNRLSVTTDGVLIDLSAQLASPLMEGTHFELKESNLMGDKAVEITPGLGAAPLSLDPPPRGDVQTGLSGFIAGLDTLVGRIENILSMLSNNDGLVASVQSAVDTTRALMTNLNATVRENRPALQNAIEDLAATTRRTSHLLRENGAIDNTVSSMPEIAAQTQQALSRFESASVELEELARAVHDGDGTTGKLISDDELHERLLRVTSQIDSLVTDIKRNPKRYFEVKVF